ncbi:ABC transporter ATP-binding protein [Vibrio sp. RC27]
MLELRNVSVTYGKTTVLDTLSLSVSAGETLAVVGESGAGKSTLINVILNIVPLDSGTITWSANSIKCCRPSLVMQEPRAAFNPALPLLKSILEPLHARDKDIDHGRLETLCTYLGMPIELLNRKPTSVSIGQVQRAGILRALMAESPLILFDEPLSALDATTQKHTAKLIANLQHELGFTALIVTHDLGYAAAYSDNIAVLHKGRIEEITPTSHFIQAPQSRYGHELRTAAFALGALEPAQ